MCIICNGKEGFICSVCGQKLIAVMAQGLLAPALQAAIEKQRMDLADLLAGLLNGIERGEKWKQQENTKRPRRGPNNKSS